MTAKTNDYLYSEKKSNSDEFITPRYGVEPLLEFIEPFKKKIIWCPFDTADSEFVKVFFENGYNIVYSHINSGHDFYTYEPEKWDVLISNPPFRGKRHIFERALSFNKPFALLNSLTWLNDAAPKEIFYPDKLQLLMFNKRMKFNGCPSNKINFSSAYYCYKFLPKDLLIRML